MRVGRERSRDPTVGKRFDERRVRDLQFNTADRNRSHGVSYAFQLTNDLLVSCLSASRFSSSKNPPLFPHRMINNIQETIYRGRSSTSLQSTRVICVINAKQTYELAFLFYLLNGRSSIFVFSF